jgi:hypothetical protein
LEKWVLRLTSKDKWALGVQTVRTPQTVKRLGEPKAKGKTGFLPVGEGKDLTSLVCDRSK